MSWKIRVRTEFVGHRKQNKPDSLRDQVTKLMKGCGIRWNTNTDVWESDTLDPEKAAQKLKSIMDVISQHPDELRHMWLYLEQNEEVPRTYQPRDSNARRDV